MCARAGESEPRDQWDQWLREARQGSREALGRLLDGCRRYLLLVADRRLDHDLRGKVGASDAVQETFLEAQRDFPQFRGETEEDLRGWLRRILLNNLANVSRRYLETEKRRLAREAAPAGTPLGDRFDGIAAGGDSPSAEAMAREQTETLDRALEQLPDHYREAILLRHRERLGFEEIGRRLGRSAEAARKLWARAVDQLQQALEPPDAPG